VTTGATWWTAVRKPVLAVAGVLLRHIRGRHRRSARRNEEPITCLRIGDRFLRIVFIEPLW